MNEKYLFKVQRAISGVFFCNTVVLHCFHGSRKQAQPPVLYFSMQLGLRTFAVAKASDYFSEAAHYAEEKDTAQGQTEANDK